MGPVPAGSLANHKSRLCRNMTDETIPQTVFSFFFFFTFLSFSFSFQFYVEMICVNS